jgi:inhibitor of KinA
MTGASIFPLAPGALTVDFGNEISVDLNDRAISIAKWFEQNPFPGFIESAPAYSSVAIFYDLTAVRRNFPQFATAFDAVKSLIPAAFDGLQQRTRGASPLIEIPVEFGGSAGPDLKDIANDRRLSMSEVIDIFVSRTYRVFMLGFLPGFPYMGEVDERIAVPRKKTPRTHVAKGSVGIAGRQTGIYSLESPGGWQIIGRTSVDMFTPRAERPALLRPGDEVRFVTTV